MDFMGSIAAAGQALDIVKKLRELDGDLKQAEVKLQLADLYGKLADVKIALADAQTELRAKDAEISSLKEVNDGKLKTFRRNGYVYGIDENGKPLPKAFCTPCLSKGSQFMVSEAIAGHAICPGCGTVYDSAEVTLPTGFTLPST